MNHISLSTFRRWTAGAAVFVALAACGGDDSTNDTGDGEESASETSDTSASEETTTTEGLPPEHQEVLDAYQDAWDAVVAAYDPADPEHPDLLATHAGQALVNHQAFLTNYQLEGVSVVATSSENDPEVASLTGDEAIVEDCVEEVLEYFDSETREPTGEPEDSVAHSYIHMERRDGTWMVVRGEPLGDSC